MLSLLAASLYCTRVHWDGTEENFFKRIREEFLLNINILLHIFTSQKSDSSELEKAPREKCDMIKRPWIFSRDVFSRMTMWDLNIMFKWTERKHYQQKENVCKWRKIWKSERINFLATTFWLSLPVTLFRYDDGSSRRPGPWKGDVIYVNYGISNFSRFVALFWCDTWKWVGR